MKCLPFGVKIKMENFILNFIKNNINFDKENKINNKMFKNKQIIKKNIITNISNKFAYLI